MHPDVAILSTPESAYFADLIHQKLQCGERVQIERRRFPGGERYHRIMNDDPTFLMGKTAVFVGSTHTDEALNELYEVGCALATGNGTYQRIFVIPFLGYSTMERAANPNEVVKAKTVARLLSSIPATGLGNAFLFHDLHASQFVHYLEGSCFRIELYAKPIMKEALQNLILMEGLINFVFATVDLGRPKLVAEYAKYFRTGLVLIMKDREFEKTEVLQVIGDVSDKDVVICDDMTRSAGSLVQAAKAYLQKGAKRIYAVLSHLALDTESVIDLLENSPIRKIIATNSHPMSLHPRVHRSGSSKFIIKDVSSVFVEPIRKLIGVL